MAIVDAAPDGRTNIIDTADIYSNGVSEEMVGKAIAGRRDDIAGPPAVATRRRRTPCSPPTYSTRLTPSLLRAWIWPPHEKFDTPPALLDPSLRRRPSA
jgi:aryl-alcohol dehydrogenase-like predicted oxidoreductase